MKTLKIVIPFITISCCAFIIFKSDPVRYDKPNNPLFITNSQQEQTQVLSTIQPAPALTGLPSQNKSEEYFPSEKYPVKIGFNNLGINPQSNIYTIVLIDKPDLSKKIWLEYDLFGMQDFTCIPHNINDNLAIGGYWKIINNGWTHQKEQISASNLKQGSNIFRFSAPGSGDFKYIVKNLSLKIENESVIHRRLVLNQPSTAYYYKKFGYIEGFVQGDQSDKAIITVSGKQVTTLNGTFEQLVQKPQNSSEEWSVKVAAVFPDGEKIESLLNFDHSIDCEIISETSKTVDYIETLVASDDNLSMHLNGICLDGTQGAVKSDTKISVLGLRDIDFPTMDPGLVNVTEKAGGYRCLPHGTTFSDEVKLSMEYDPARLPSGYTPNDIYTYYFDESLKGWVALPRDSVDIANNIIVSRTTHFTDFINGIIKVPESPLTQAYTPTSIKDIKAANPLEAMGVIQPPTANNTGAAKLSYPLVIPAGRKGMQPQLALQYTSGGENGWMGAGWNISLPSISVETRWGVPHYDPTKESETYCLNGEQLATRDANGFYLPLPHRASWVNRIYNHARFYPRVEGSFDSIIRHGNNPSDYYWEVVDRNGITSFYGKKIESASVDTSAVLRDDEGNIAYWALTETKDLFENSVRYYYDIVSNVGVAGGTNQGKQIYISQINYTGHQSDSGYYNIFFERYDTANYKRSDVTISGRYGFKEVTADLLRKIKIMFGNYSIRNYYFGYDVGEFGKTLLCGFYEQDYGDEQGIDIINDPRSVCTYLNSPDHSSIVKVHKFGYYNDYNSVSQDFQAFGEEQVIDSYDDDLATIGGSSALNMSKTDQWGVGGALTVGFGANPFSKNPTVGGYYNYNASKSKKLNVTLMDINGDGLLDKVFAKDGHMYYRKQYLCDTCTHYKFSSTAFEINIPEFIYQESESDAFGAQATFYSASGSYQHSTSTSTTSVYFADVNGDGLPDIVNNDKVYFNSLDINGNPHFAISTDTDTVYVNDSSCNYIIYTGHINDTVLISTNNIRPPMTELISIPFDAVRVWIVPFNGMVDINAPIQLIQDFSDARAMSRHVDGIRYTIQHNDVELVDDTINPNNYTQKNTTNSALNNIVVEQGDTIFFRLQSRNNRSFDNVEWDPVITYKGCLQKYDANGKVNQRYQASDDFILEENRWIGAPVGGTIKIEGRIVMPTLSDSVTFKIIKNTTSIYSQPYTGLSAVDDSVVLTVNADSLDSLSFQLVANTNVDWNSISFNPHVYFISNTAALPDTNDDGSRNIEFYPVVHHTMFTKPLSSSNPYVLDDFPNTTVRPYPSFKSATIDGNMVFVVKSNNTTIAKQFLTVTNGQINNPTWIPLTLSLGQEVYFEYYSMDTSLMYQIQSALVDVADTNLDLEAGAHTIYPSEFLKFGSLFRGWGQFTYNPDTAEANQPIVTSSLVWASTMVNDVQMSQNPDTTSFIAFVNDFNSYYNPLANKMIIMTPDVIKNDYEDYTGYTSVSSANMRNCRQYPDSLVMTLDDPIPLPVYVGQEIKTVRKQTISDNYSYGVGYNPVSASFSYGNNELKSDFFDINGDRYPDIIGPEYAQVTTPQGGLSELVIPHWGYIDSRSNYSEYESYGATFGTSFISVNKVITNNPKTGKYTTSRQASVSASAGYNDDETKYTWQDVNGDGLPDKVNSDGAVCMNLGYKFLPAETWDFSSLRTGKSYNVALNVSGAMSNCYSITNHSFSGGVGFGTSTNSTKESLMDINGDGLSDRLIVNNNNIDAYINTGNGFLANPITVTQPNISQGVSFNKSINIGVTFGFTIPIFTFPVKFCINPSFNKGTSYNNEKVQLTDMNGDGYPDYVTSDDEQHIRVRYSTIGRTNLLKNVDNYLGGSFELDYKLSSNSIDMPQRSWTMSSLKVYDGFPEDGPEYSYYTFTYDSGYYNRFERQSYGFKIVTTNQFDSPQATVPYRSTIEKFHNNTFTFKNLKFYELTVNTDSKRYIESKYTYDLKEIATGIVIPTANPDCYGEGYPAISKEDKYFYEALDTVGIHTRKRYDHGSNGNIKTYYDDGDTADSLDNIYADVYYHPDLYSKHIISIPDSILVKQDTVIYRKRATSINYYTGAVTQIRMYNNSAVSVYDLAYDSNGNLSQITYPPNANNERMSYWYTYDATVKTYPYKVWDTLGYLSETVYDPRYGKLLSSKDISGKYINYTLDNRGRIISIQGPLEQLISQPYTIRFEYWDKYGGLDTQFRADNVPWARTFHYDPSNPNNDIETVLFADAQGKILQTKKDVSVYNTSLLRDEEKVTVSGRIYYDGLGRAIENYYPILDTLGRDSIFIYTTDTVPPTVTSYDILDRADTIIKPDNSTTVMSYGFGLDRDSVKRFLTTTTDANHITTRVYKDPTDKETSIHSPYDTWTSFNYDAVGQLVSSLDPENKKTQYSYDLLGRRISREHPDAGRTYYNYDNAGNMIQQLTQNLLLKSLNIEYNYYYNKLRSAIYPENPENNVHYEYGAPGTGNQSSRLVKQQDVNGVQQFTYDELGNVKMNTKTMIVPFDSIYTFRTTTTFDTWNRIREIEYPDGEVVTYDYNEGGLLREMNGDKNGSSAQYVEHVGYDKFESRVKMEYGNGTKIYYQYDTRRRHLNSLRSVSVTGNYMMDNTYIYDAVDNITDIINNGAPDTNNIGGSVSNHYDYDSLYRLTTSEGSSLTAFSKYAYYTSMQYYPSGKIHSKENSISIDGVPIPSLSYSSLYSYNNTQPHAPDTIGDCALSYDRNGNLLFDDDLVGGTLKFYSWDEENRMKLTGRSEDNLGYYLYDGGGERTLKIVGNFGSMVINGRITVNSYQSANQTLYVNPYLVINNREYTKHYYIENQRIVSKLGGGFLNSPVPLFSMIYDTIVKNSGDYLAKMQSDEGMIIRDIDSCGLPGILVMTDSLYNFLQPMESSNYTETDVYFYHPDHLGSTSYVSNAIGMPTQHVDYLPFGEVLLEERTGTWHSPYKFNGKEQDEESGLYYYGARYYDPRMSVFLGVDPLSDKFPFESPFTYCHNNPVILKDPDGRAGVAVVNKDSKTITIRANYYVQSVASNGYSPTAYSPGVIKGMQNDINQTLNSSKYSVSEGAYAGYAVQFDLQFKEGGDRNNTNILRTSDYVDGFQISNSIMGGDEYTNPKYFTEIDNGDGSITTLGGFVNPTPSKDEIYMNRKFDTKRNKIHEIFHSLYFNKDGADTGIGSYDKLDMPNQEDINSLINNSELPKIEDK